MTNKRQPRRRKETPHNPRAPKPSVAFERQIQQIHELLEGSGAVVTWDDRIVDPDRPTRRRQIDVTIRRGEHLTLIECRLRRSPQDVQWIEELIGRRQSLRADAVIAVSSSGFTRTALAKGKAHGVTMRELRTLTEQEVRNWGRSVSLTLYFFAYSDVHVNVLFDVNSLARLNSDALRAELARHLAWVSIFNAAAEIVGRRLIPAKRGEDLTAKFGARLELEGFRLCGQDVLAVEIEGKARMVAYDLKAPTVSEYTAPSATPSFTVVQQFPFGDTSVVHDGGRISTFIDLSNFDVPPLHQFRYAQVQSEYMVEHEVFSIGGIAGLYIGNGPIEINVVGVGSSPTQP